MFNRFISTIIFISLFISCGGSSSKNPAQTAYIISHVSSLNDARYYHTGTLLVDGNVLIAGGYRSADYRTLKSFEIIDTKTMKISITGSLAYSRNAHTATRLNDGKVLLVGGQDGNNSNYSDCTVAEIYDPNLNQTSITDSIPESRAHHSSVLLKNGKILIVGGSGTGGFLKTALLYNPILGKFHPTGDMSITRVAPGLTLLDSGKVLVVGGFSDVVGATNSSEIYDPDLGTFSTAPAPGVAGLGPYCTKIPDGRVIFAGGFNSNSSPQSLNSVVIYDDASNSFKSLNKMSNPRSGHTINALSNGYVVVIAGQAQLQLNDIEIINPTTGDMQQLSNLLPTVLSQHVATNLFNDQILITGGRVSSNSSSAIYLFKK